MRPIRYASQTVAFCDGDDVLLAPQIAVLEPDHPTRRFVSMLCIYSAELDTRAANEAGCFSAAEAERYARCELIPDDLFEALACRPDHELAEDFVVPLEQINEKRRDLAQVGRSSGTRLP